MKNRNGETPAVTAGDYSRKPLVFKPKKPSAFPYFRRISKSSIVTSAWRFFFVHVLAGGL